MSSDLCPDPAAALLHTSLAMLKDMKQFVQNCPSNQCLYWESKVIPGSTLGKHIRHTADHWNTLLGSIRNRLPSPSARGSRLSPADYAKRVRGGHCETDKSSAVAMLEDVSSSLENLLPDLLGMYYPENKEEEKKDKQQQQHCALELTVRAMFPNDLGYVELPSCLQRELWFCVHHAIHHCAMMRMICYEMKVSSSSSSEGGHGYYDLDCIPPTFGYAPSTVKHIEELERDSKRAKKGH
eukprot:Nk52_evm73s151 gene=Nk52_evmTU73s151